MIVRQPVGPICTQLEKKPNSLQHPVVSGSFLLGQSRQCTAYICFRTFLRRTLGSWLQSPFARASLVSFLLSLCANITSYTRSLHFLPPPRQWALFFYAFLYADVYRRTRSAPCTMEKQAQLPPRKRLWRFCTRFVLFLCSRSWLAMHQGLYVSTAPEYDIFEHDWHSYTIGTLAGLSSGLASPASCRWTTMDGGSNVGRGLSICVRMYCWFSRILQSLQPSLVPACWVAWMLVTASVSACVVFLRIPLTRPYQLWVPSSPGELVSPLDASGLTSWPVQNHLVAPSLVKNGLAFGVPVDPNFPQIISYQAMSFSDVNKYVTAPSPRYWLLWPGVLMMLLYSFADVVMSLVPVFQSESESKCFSGLTLW